MTTHQIDTYVADRMEKLDNLRSTGKITQAVYDLQIIKMRKWVKDAEYGKWDDLRN